jgi:hypothetical protein
LRGAYSVVNALNRLSASGDRSVILLLGRHFHLRADLEESTTNTLKQSFLFALLITMLPSASACSDNVGTDMLGHC